MAPPSIMSGVIKIEFGGTSGAINMENGGTTGVIKMEFAIFLTPISCNDDVNLMSIQ